MELDGKIESKLLVVLGHTKGFCICIKATSKIARFQTPTLTRGVVFYKSNELSFFTLDTVIQPENQFPIRHSDIARFSSDGTFTVVGKMPDDFGEKLKKAIEQSALISEIRREKIQELLAS